MERHKLYDNIDGTGEMFMGLMLLGFALLGYLQAILPEHSIWRTNMFASLLFMYAVLILVLGPGYLLRRVIKKHITWPRTGYVAGHSLWRLMLAPRLAGREAAPGVPTRKGLWYTMLALGFVAAIVAAGLACLVAFERRHFGAMTGLAGVGADIWVLYLAHGKGTPVEMAVIALHGAGASRNWSHRFRQFYRGGAVGDVLRWRCVGHLRLGYSVFIHPAHLPARC